MAPQNSHTGLDRAPARGGPLETSAFGSNQRPLSQPLRRRSLCSISPTIGHHHAALSNHCLPDLRSFASKTTRLLRDLRLHDATGAEILDCESHLFGCPVSRHRASVDQSKESDALKHEVPQECPLCARPAHYIPVDYGNRKYFRCEHCTYFQISNAAAERLSKAPQEWRNSYALRAQEAPKDHLLFIRIPQASARDAGVALEGEYLLRSEAPS